MICAAVPTPFCRSGGCDVVDAVTGQLLAHTEQDSLVDFSGAHVWCEMVRGVFASAAPGSSTCRMLDVQIAHAFRFGVLVVNAGGDWCRVLRVDCDVSSDAEPRHKFRIVDLWWCGAQKYD